MKRKISGFDKVKSLANNFHYILLFLIIATYSIILSIVSIDNYNRFRYSAFDIGIFDQGIWLLSKGKGPFVTVRGLHLFGDHIQFISIFLAPFFWVWDDARILLILQSIALGLGALPIYLIAREKLKSKWIPFVFVFSYLFYPSLHYLNLENFHLVSFAVPTLLFTFYFLMKKSYKLFLIFVWLALITREELALTALAIGIYAFFYYNKKIGIVTIIFSLVWLFLIFKVIFPYYVPFPHPNLKRGGDIFDRVRELFINPKSILIAENGKYLFDIFSPVAFIPFLNPQTLFLALPALGINLITTWPYARSIEYHYTYAVTPFIFISTIYSFSFLKNFLSKKKSKIIWKAFYVLIIIFILSSLFGNIYIGPNSTSIKENSLIETIKNFNRFNEKEKARYEAISIIPRNASVSATYLFVPHLSHRETIYMFPNPFKESYWGAEFGNFTPPTPTKDVEYIILDDTPNEFEREKVIKPLLERGTYFTIFEKDDIRVLQRNRSVEILLDDV